MPRCLECPSVQVPLECLSASGDQVPKYLKCPSVQVPFQCPSALSALSATTDQLPWEAKCLSKSVSKSASHLAGLKCWFSKLASALKANFATGATWFNFQQ